MNMRNNTAAANRRISTRPFAVSALLALAAVLALVSAAPAQTTVDYDADGDNYIEVSTHQQLNAIRYDLDGNGTVTGATAQANYAAAFPNAASGMGCAAACVGYELTEDIDLDTDGDGNIGTDSGDAYYNSGNGWIPIGADSSGNRYTGDFNGNSHTIDNLFINRSTTTHQGLFGATDPTALIEQVGVINANVTGQSNVGILVAANRGGTIQACYTTGSATGSGSAANQSDTIGGLAGWTNGTITSSYSTASVSGRTKVGGLLGEKANTGSVTNSYSTGAVTRSGGTATTIGGLVGSSISGTGTVTASYFDSTTSGCVSGGSAGCTTSAAGTAQTTHQLQAPVTYTGIYANWNANLDGVAGGDHPWYFGKHTEYPALIYGTTVNYDRDGDGYIDVENLAQLRMLWFDRTGVGNPAPLGVTQYANAFPRRNANAATRMGCPSGTCTGYELTAHLEFDTDGDGDVDPNDYHSSDYYHTTTGWHAIGSSTTYPYESNLKGNGYTINNMFINTSAPVTGLFGAISGTARVESLGVTNANVTAGQLVGILAGINQGTIVACYTTGSVSDTTTNAAMTGGLVGRMDSGSSISSSYSHASVDGRVQVGGLVGQRSGGTITNSYSIGAVTASTSTDIGGLVGNGSSGVTASYWDTETSGRATSAGGAGAVGKTTAELQAPTSYSGIYADWNANIDGQSGADDPWAFGRSSNYPNLKYGGLDVSLQSHGDYDKDNDGYIEIDSLAQLDAVRHDLDGNGDPVATAATAYGAAFTGRNTRAATRMGCPAGACAGYELTANLDFDQNGDGRITSSDSTYWNGGAGWDPIGRRTSQAARYSGNFNGNGYTINNLFINRTSGGDANTDDVGLFGAVDTSARVESLGVTNANVTARVHVGILVGVLYGDVVACYTTGSVTSTVPASQGTNSYTGGLAGAMFAQSAPPAPRSTLLSSYSTASVNGPSYVGGLVGGVNTGTITHSYSTGRVTRSGGAATTIGGLIGWTNPSLTFWSVTASYFDSTTSGCVSGGSAGCTTSAGGSGAAAKTTAELQASFGYSGDFSAWDANLDGMAGNDNPWYFGSPTEYPTLTYGKIANDVDYDADNDGYIDVENLAQLNVIRHDRDGDGAPTGGAIAYPANTQTSLSLARTLYNAVFPNAAPGMGCKLADHDDNIATPERPTCTGYELTHSLDFDQNGDGAITSADSAYWDGGSGWLAIKGFANNQSDRYSGDFKGNGYTINNLFINRSTSNQNTRDNRVGLFGMIDSASRIETLGVTNANVKGNQWVGAIVGRNWGGDVVACYTTGRVEVTNNGQQSGDQGSGGGIVGKMEGGTLSSSYSTAAVHGGYIPGGLVGRLAGGASITNSYSTGRVVGGIGISHGGLVGWIDNGTITNTHWDTLSSGKNNARGGSGGTLTNVVSKTPRQFQTQAGYTGDFSAWNADLDGDGSNDDPWEFGNNMQYPMLKYQGMNLDPQGNQAMGVPDNWNAPVVGERINVCLTPEEYPNRGIVSGQTYKEPWIWEWSANGSSDWTVISGAGDGNNPPTFEYNPVVGDVGRYIRAKVKLADGTFAYTRTLGGPVVAASGATAADSEARFVSGHGAPQVGVPIVARDPRPSSRVVDVRAGWQRCPNTEAPHTDCTYIAGYPVGHFWIRYTPTDDDIGSWLRFYVYYETLDGTWTRRVTPFTTGVVAAASP